MTSPSLKNRLTTAPISALTATTNKSQPLLALLLSLLGSPSLLAQPSWSPQPFVPTAQIQPLPDSPAMPANRLRRESTSAETKPFAARWKVPSDAERDSMRSTAAVFDETPVARSKPTTGRVSPVVASLREANASTARLPQAMVTPAANWTDRVSKPNDRVVRSIVEPTPIEHAWDERNNASVSVTAAQFDVPPATDSSTKTAQDLFESNLLPPNENPTPADTERKRSLIERGTVGEAEASAQPIAPSNPFPPRSELEKLDLVPNGDRELRERRPSPSDLDRPTPNFDRDSEKSAPPKPQSARRTEINCDDVRERALAADIGTIQLDAAPRFGAGPKDNKSPEEKRALFAKSAPQRSWLDQDGQLLSEGRLVDLAHDSIVIEAANGRQSLIPMRELSYADAVYVSEQWGLPLTCSLGSQSAAERLFEPTTVAWKASALCHKPLYFEEIQLERSGHEYGPIIQPALSTVHFFKNIAVLPYKMGIHPMNECQYPLGHYRPGNCAPWSIEPIPLSLRGLAAQAKVVTGAVLALP